MTLHRIPSLDQPNRSIRAALEPVIEAVCDLDGLVFSVIGGINAIYDRLRSVDREVAMEFNHSVSGIDQVGPVHLDFVIVLRVAERCSKDED